jgi:hypothetical protein
MQDMMNWGQGVAVILFPTAALFSAMTLLDLALDGLILDG